MCTSLLNINIYTYDEIEHYVIDFKLVLASSLMHCTNHQCRSQTIDNIAQYRLLQEPLKSRIHSHTACIIRGRGDRLGICLGCIRRTYFQRQCRHLSFEMYDTRLTRTQS